MDAYSRAGADDTGEPLANDPQTAEEMNAIAADRLMLLGESLARRRDEWVTARQASKVEKRWREDTDQYNGRDHSTQEAASMMDSVEAGFPVTNRQAKPQRSTVFVNITRPKTNAAEARLANMVLPSDDRNWGFKPTPNPILTEAAMQQAKAQIAAQAPQQPQAGQPPVGQPAGQPAAQPPATSAQGAPLSPGGAPTLPAPQSPGAPSAMSQAIIGAYPPPDYQAQLDVAARAAKAMEDEIDDLMIQCDFNGEVRKMLHDCAVLGTGVTKGPIVINRVRKAYKKLEGTNVWELQIEEEKTPASECVSPWNVYPDPGCGEDIHDGIGIFEKKEQTSRQLRELTKQPGYLKEQVSKVLQEGPTAVPDVSQRDGKNESGGRESSKDHFQLWEYWGEFLPEDLRAAGVNVPDGATESISGCVILVNQTVIKGFLNPIETGDLPYDFLVWEKVDGEPWGYGVPHLMRSPQKVLNAAWRQMMDNAGLSVGPQIVVDPEAVVPADGIWQLTGRKLWYKNGADVDIKAAFATFNIDSHAEELQSIIKLAQEFCDEESSTPQLAQGEKGTAPDTVGGMTILMNSSNVVLGRMVKQFDDNFTRPHLRRYYDWYMAYGSKDECKGDFQVDARGTSVLLVRDAANQALLGLGEYAANGTIAPMVNWEQWFKAILKAQHIDPTDIMKTDAEIAQLAAQPPAATPEQIRANAQLQVAQIEAQARKDIAAAKVQGEKDYAQIEQQTAAQDAAAREKEANDKIQIAVLQYLHEEKLKAADLQADAANTNKVTQTQRELAAAEHAVRTSEAHRDRQHEANMAVTHAMLKPQVSKPIPNQQ